MNDYEAFLNSKKLTTVDSGKTCGDIHPALFPFQRDIVSWAVRKGRAAIFADVGLGKTVMYCEWCRQLSVPTLILTPLAVAQQTVNMAKSLLDMELRYVRSMAEVDFDNCLFYVTNYEMLEHFDAAQFQAVVLDESSILKAFSGKTKLQLIRTFKDTPYKLACTATPAPNDLLEIGNHADFLSVMSSRLMTSFFFTHDSQAGKNGNKYRLKKHATGKFYEWLASWAVALKKPSDLGYDDTGYDLPELNIELKTVNAGYTPAGMLEGFGVQSISAVDAKKVRRATIASRSEVAVSQITAASEQWLVWTGLNDEAAHLTKHIQDSFDLHGSLKPDEKVQAIQDFVQGKTRVLVTKSSIAGMGVNMQQCANMLFFGVDYSWEQFYQSIGRIYRFGQKAQRVNVVIVTSEEERSVFEAIQRKGEEARMMTDELIEASRKHMQDSIHGAAHADWTYREDEASGKNWKLLLGDSCQRMKEIATDSVHLSVYSPPFGGTIYIYSATERDLGNSKSNEEFLAHYGEFIVPELLRITMPGRYACVHIQDTKIYGLNNGGNRGLYPLSDELVRLHIAAGWTFRSRITIDKNPQAVATRNHDNDLLFVTGKRDGCDLAPMNTDYLLVFEKPGKNPVPVKPYDNGDMTEDEWITWARACWYDIRETDVLNVDVARANEDERHLCPLQLPLIGRCVRMWSNPGETVFSPFGGIGSELYEALRWKRRGLGIELKPEYFRVAVRNLENAERSFGGRTLFDLLPADAAAGD